MDDLQKVFGENVRKYRKRLKLTQSQLSELIDVSPSFIGYIENGKTYPSFKTIALLAKALQVSPGHLFEQEEIQQTRTKVGLPYASNKETEYNPAITRVIHDLEDIIRKYKPEATLNKKAKKTPHH